MSKTVTLRIDDKLYNKLKEHAKTENRTLSNFIETATLRYVEQIEFVDDYEMDEILANKDLLARLKSGSLDSKNKRGSFV